MWFSLRNSLILNNKFLNTFKCLSRSINAECLKDRSVISIQGDESSDFLQGLMTNDMNHLENDGSCMYTMFLNVQGRVLFEANIFRKSTDQFLIDCDASTVPSAIRHLKAHKVRRKINIDHLSAFKMWALFKNSVDFDNLEQNDIDGMYKKSAAQSEPSIDKINLPESACITVDPRVKYLGDRVILSADSTLEGIEGVEICEDEYKILRYKLGIGEGSVDVIPGKTLPLQANCDYLHGVSFHKGCYIGQELTARSFHTGVIRRRYMPIVVENNQDTIEQNTDIVNEKGKNVGKVVNVFRGFGIGLMRIEECLKADALSANGFKIVTFRPGWWPFEAPKEKHGA